MDSEREGSCHGDMSTSIDDAIPSPPRTHLGGGPYFLGHPVSFLTGPPDRRKMFEIGC